MIHPCKRQITGKGMHIARYMADGGTIQACNIIKVEMQEVLGCLLLPGQPMIYNFAEQTLVLDNLHRIMDDYKMARYQKKRDGYAKNRDV